MTFVTYSGTTTLSITSGSTSSEISTAVVTSGELTTYLVTSSELTSHSATTASLDTSSELTTPSNRKSTLYIIVGVVGATSVAVLSLGIFILYKRRKKNIPIQMDDVELSQERPKRKKRPPVLLTKIEIGEKINSKRDGIDMFVGDWNGTQVMLKKVVNEHAIELLEKEAQILRLV